MKENPSLDLQNISSTSISKKSSNRYKEEKKEKIEVGSTNQVPIPMSS